MLARCAIKRGGEEHVAESSVALRKIARLPVSEAVYKAGFAPDAREEAKEVVDGQIWQE